MVKREISKIFREIALMLEIKGDNPFKIRAYENGARALEVLDGDIDGYIVDGKIEGIKGIGEALSEKILELHETGMLKFYEDLKSSIPTGLFELIKIPGIGPKKARVLNENLSIETIGELEYACLENRLVELPNFGEKSQSNILKGIQVLKKARGKFLYGDVIEIAEGIIEKLLESELVERCEIAGSLRRKKEIVKDIDIVASSEKPKDLMDYLVSLPVIEDVIEKGSTKTSVILNNGINMDIRVVRDREFPYALHHFTGSKEHNTALRHRAKSLGIKINEYGLFHNEKLLLCKDEKDIYKELGLEYIPPELRENSGEIEVAIDHSLPELIEYKDLQGMLHIHTKYSDGSNTIEELVEKAKLMGFSYIGIADHSKSAFYARGLEVERVLKQAKEIDELNSKLKNFRILKGIESDILSDGSLDYDDDILSQFDYVIASVHSNLRMEKDKMTKRIIRAIENKYTTIIGHLSNRLLLAREESEMDLEAVLNAAAKHNKIIEINADPRRLDIDWRYIKHAKRKGIKFAINPDAHSLHGMENIKFGIGIARKGWLGADDIINSMGIEEVMELFDYMHK